MNLDKDESQYIAALYFSEIWVLKTRLGMSDPIMDLFPGITMSISISTGHEYGGLDIVQSTGGEKDHTEMQERGYEENKKKEEIV